MYKSLPNPQSKQSAKSFSPVVGIGSPPPLLPQASAPLPSFGSGGRGHTRLRDMGGGGVPIPTRKLRDIDIHCGTLQRHNAENFKQIFPEKEYRGLSLNFHIHVSVSELYIPTMGPSFLLEEICEPILGIYKSLTDTWMWKLRLRPRNSQKRNI